MLLTDKFIQVKHFRTLSLKRNLFTDKKKANYGSDINTSYSDVIMS